MIAISINDLTLRFGTTTILEKVSFSLEENDKLGIIGVNGSGKSSLFKLILGEYEPEEGNVYISKGKSVGVLTQEGAFTVSDLCGDTALEQMYTAFPELLAMESRIAYLEGELAKQTGRDPALGNSLTTEYTELYNRFVRGGGLEFRGRCASILQKMGFDEGFAASRSICSAAVSVPVWRWHVSSAASRTSFCWTSRPTIWTWKRWRGWSPF
jgi:ATP-binding cassette subfamily F protein 3